MTISEIGVSGAYAPIYKVQKTGSSADNDSQPEITSGHARQEETLPYYSRPLMANQTIADTWAAVQQAAEAQANQDKTAADEFLELMEMTPEERMFALRLKQLGYTQEEFEQLPLEEQEKIRKEIEDAIHEEVENAVEDKTTAEVQQAAVSTDIASNRDMAASPDDRQNIAGVAQDPLGRAAAFQGQDDDKYRK